MTITISNCTIDGKVLENPNDSASQLSMPEGSEMTINGINWKLVNGKWEEVCK